MSSSRLKYFLWSIFLLSGIGQPLAGKQLKISSFGFQVTYPDSLSKKAVAEVSPWFKLTDPSDHPASKSPEHLFFRFPGPYQEAYDKLRDKNMFTFAPEIHFYPIEGFQEVFSVEPKYVAKLKQDISSFEKLLTQNDPKPKYLQDTLFMAYPFGDVAGTFLARPQKLKFKQGEGIAFLTQIYFDMAPFNPEQLVYVFQGLSKGSKYLITATFPVKPDMKVVAESHEDFYKSKASDPKAYSEYLEKTRIDLEKLSDKQFDPPLALLDKVIESLIIH